MKERNNRILFDVKNLRCGYDGVNTVLQIPHLTVPANKMIFILGLSGIGKSTFIETLGVMNDTIINKKEAQVVFNNNSNESTNLVDFWKMNDDEQSEFRKHNLSFIFQNTNLMSNMSAGENVCISMLLDGVSSIEAKRRTLEIFSELNLSEDKFDKKITELSGGERQRIAFVRGLLSNFEVLFGDEPTGNLDKKTAMDVMKSIKNTLIKLNRSSIIVTHDPDLALNFGDGILLIEPKIDKNGNTIGWLTDKNLYQKGNDDKWFDIDKNEVSGIKSIVLKALNMNKLKII